MSLDKAVDLVEFAFRRVNPGDLFIQKARASTIGDPTEAIRNLPGRTEVRATGARYGERLYETLMTCEGGRRCLKCLCASAAATDVALNFAPIPVFGASGAAFASLVTQVSTTMVLPFAIRPLRPNAMLMLDAILLRGVLPVRRG